MNRPSMVAICVHMMKLNFISPLTCETDYEQNWSLMHIFMVQGESEKVQ